MGFRNERHDVRKGERPHQTRHQISASEARDPRAPCAKGLVSPRRNLLLGALVLVGGYGAVRYGLGGLVNLLADDLEFERLAEPAGFRRLDAGPSSIGFDPFFGLERDGQESRSPVANIQDRLCSALFGSGTPPSGVVPIASFSDYYCPYCRVLTKRLAALEASSNGTIRVTWHELPLLGQGSLDAAKAALAAGRQGAYTEFHRRLMRTPFRPSRAYIIDVADDLGIDGERMLFDIESPAVLREIDESRALAGLFGFIGTPALVVGRTALQGEIDDATLRRLIARERADGPIPGCVDA